jgi:hypothetical protein
MEGALESGNVYTKQQRIAELGKRMPDVGFTSLAYYIDLEWMYVYRCNKNSNKIMSGG